MGKLNKKLLINILVVTILIILARLLRLMISNMENLVIPTLLIYIRGVIHLSLTLVWTISIYNRITNKQARAFVLAVGILMIFWIIAKTTKYEFFPNNTEDFARYLWYCYYIPMLLIPLNGIFVSQYIHKPDDYRLPKWRYILYIPVFLLLVGIITNDFHNLMFAFPNGIDNFNSDYTYGVLYWCSMAWYISLTLAFVIILIHKSRIPGSKVVQKIPLVIAIIAVLFWILYTAGLIDGDLTIIDCIIIGVLLETTIQTGLIPTNTNHNELFKCTTVPVMIIDNDYQVKYSSGGAIPISEEIIKATLKAPIVLKDSILHSALINAGRVVWQDDISELNRQREDLNDVRQQLSEEAILIQAENDIKEQQAKADEQNKLYNKIASDVKPQLDIIAKLLDKVEHGENINENLSRIAIIGSYVKRRGNLLLLEKGECGVPLHELENALRESSENLKLLNIASTVYVRNYDNISLKYAIKAYDLYEQIIEISLENINAIFIHLSLENETLHLSLQLEANNETFINNINNINTIEKVNIEIEENNIYVDLLIGGDTK